MAFDVNEFLGAYKAPRFPVSITLRADLQAELAQLNDELVSLPKSEAMNNPRPVEIVEEMKRIVDELKASQRTFEFEAIGAYAYQKLQDAHPALPKAKAEGAIVHLETFYPAVVAACSVEPKLTVADAEKLRERLSDNQWTKLVSAAIGVNLGDDATPKFDPRSLLAVVQPRSSGTPTIEESLAASSSDE